MIKKTVWVLIIDKPGFWPWEIGEFHYEQVELLGSITHPFSVHESYLVKTDNGKIFETNQIYSPQDF